MGPKEILVFFHCSGFHFFPLEFSLSRHNAVMPRLRPGSSWGHPGGWCAGELLAEGTHICCGGVGRRRGFGVPSPKGLHLRLHGWGTSQESRGPPSAWLPISVRGLLAGWHRAWGKSPFLASPEGQGQGLCGQLHPRLKRLQSCSLSPRVTVGVLA